MTTLPTVLPRQSTAVVVEEPIILHVVTCSRCPKWRSEHKDHDEAERIHKLHNLRHRAWDFRRAIQQKQLPCPCRHHQYRELGDHPHWVEPTCVYCLQWITPFEPNGTEITGEEARHYAHCYFPWSEEELDRYIERSLRIQALG